MAKRLPRRCLIGSRVYKITRLNMPGVLGECDRTDKIISICTKNPEEARHTLFHEILHAIYYEYSLKPGDREEQTVRKLEVGVMQVLQDNKDVRDYIFL